MTVQNFDAIRSWMVAAEALGEYVGIRFGHIPRGKLEPEWTFLSHKEFDGIGGLADLLRGRGAHLERLSQIKHPSTPSAFACVRLLPRFLSPRQRLSWARTELGTSSGAESNPGRPPHEGKGGPPTGVAWHVFDEAMTLKMRHVCRTSGVTVNSFLLKHLTKAIRPYLADQSSGIPWMVPVNMRGKVTQERDTANHSSFVTVRINSYETARDVHRQIYAALSRGEHWANWYSYQLARVLSNGMQRFLIANELATASWHVGGFSNLGDWDPNGEIGAEGCLGDWLFCPPVLSFQVVGAGCVTFQNRLSITLQTHHSLSSSPALARAWVGAWLREIEIDLDSRGTMEGGSAELRVPAPSSLADVPGTRGNGDRGEG